jgi:hypothetical protein
VIRIDEGRIQEHLGEVVRSTVERSGRRANSEVLQVASGTEDWPTLVVDKPQNSLAKGARRNDSRKRPSGFYGICFGDCASQIRIAQISAIGRTAD